MIELRNYMYECFCNKYKVRHFYNPFTCEIVYYPSNEINNNFYSKRCKYFSDYNFCKNNYCHYKHLKDIELPVENDITDTLIERHTTESGEIGWKITKPSYDVMASIKPTYNPTESTESLYLSYDIQKQQELPVYPLMDPTYPSYEPTYPSYEPTYKKPKLLPETTKVCCHYHNKYRPKNEMIKEQLENNKIIWMCSKDNQCKIATIM